jgi:hypothetical protein
MLKQSPDDSPGRDGNESARSDCRETAAVHADHDFTPAWRAFGGVWGPQTGPGDRTPSPRNPWRKVRTT